MNFREVVIFLIYSQFGAIWKPDPGRMNYKTYIFNSSNLLSYKSKKFVTQLSYYCFDKGTIFATNCSFFAKNADISKIKVFSVLKLIFSETTYVCVRTYQVSSITLTTFRREVILPTPPSPQIEPLKTPPRLRLT